MSLIPILELEASSFYVSTSASVSGDGSKNNPWQLQTALNHPSTLLPGDTVWIFGGLYAEMYNAQTSYNCFTKGTSDKPIIFRNYNNERVTLDGQLTYTLFLGLGNCSYTWFWGIEVSNSASTDRNHDIPGSVSCSAEHIKFINMIVHDTGSGLDTWKTAKNTEVYGCIIYHIGNNLNNGGNLEGHGHGMYVQNDTFGTRALHNNIIFSTYGYAMKVWQTTTTSAIGNLDIQNNILFNGGAASENLGGVGNNYRTHNFFVVSNGVNNPVTNTVIKHNYTYAGLNTPRPPVNAFGLNYGVKGMTLDSNYLTCQTRLGYNNTPIFEASIKGNRIIGGIPAVYGVYLWGFAQTDFPENTFVPNMPNTGLDYFLIPNSYEKGRGHLAIYNWDSLASVQVDISALGFSPGDQYELVNVMDYFNDIIDGTYTASGIIEVPMIDHTFQQAIGSNKLPVSQFPAFGAFLIRKKEMQNTTIILPHEIQYPDLIIPNPSNGTFTLKMNGKGGRIKLFNLFGDELYSRELIRTDLTIEIDLTAFGKGIYILHKESTSGLEMYKLIVQ
jgi:hypothetical protein